MAREQAVSVLEEKSENTNHATQTNRIQRFTMPTNLISQTTQTSIWEIAEQVPALMVLVVLVSWFLKYLKDEREFQKNLSENQGIVIQNMESMLMSLSEALGRAVAIMERMERRINGNGD